MSWALLLQGIELLLCGNHIYDISFASVNFLFLPLGELTWNFYSCINIWLDLAHKHHLSSPTPDLLSLVQQDLLKVDIVYIFGVRIQNYVRIVVVLVLVSLKSKISTGMTSISLKAAVSQGLSGSQSECISWNSRPRLFKRVWVWKMGGENHKVYVWFHVLFFSRSNLRASINSELLKSNNCYCHYYLLSFPLNNVSNIFLLVVLFVSIYIKYSVGMIL